MPTEPPYRLCRRLPGPLVSHPAGPELGPGADAPPGRSGCAGRDAAGAGEDGEAERSGATVRKQQRPGAAERGAGRAGGSGDAEPARAPAALGVPPLPGRATWEQSPAASRAQAWGEAAERAPVRPRATRPPASAPARHLLLVRPGSCTASGRRGCRASASKHSRAAPAPPGIVAAASLPLTRPLPSRPGPTAGVEHPQPSAGLRASRLGSRPNAETPRPTAGPGLGWRRGGGWGRAAGGAGDTPRGRPTRVTGTWREGAPGPRKGRGRGRGRGRARGAGSGARGAGWPAAARGSDWPAGATPPRRTPKAGRVSGPEAQAPR